MPPALPLAGACPMQNLWTVVERARKYARVRQVYGVRATLPTPHIEVRARWSHRTSRVPAEGQHVPSAYDALLPSNHRVDDPRDPYLLPPTRHCTFDQSLYLRQYILRK